ncbi:unnamed protein product [Vitrella brassicaformis CCMP3155]|uniref:Uncharacterized protein n=4 Tax=Vitrella brassicaformis TaxID=1169539 RepID=A0A0G4H3X9_VITBC|nr:unnamed protein product [Vitrella brassicaformis CCMP3155]|eukprot:CEM38411.1 unnamed protein product [Vitrella brassicaformis CCMP3155]
MPPMEGSTNDFNMRDGLRDRFACPGTCFCGRWLVRKVTQWIRGGNGAHQPGTSSASGSSTGLFVRAPVPPSCAEIGAIDPTPLLVKDTRSPYGHSSHGRHQGLREPSSSAIDSRSTSGDGVELCNSRDGLLRSVPPSHVIKEPTNTPAQASIRPSDAITPFQRPPVPSAADDLEGDEITLPAMDWVEEQPRLKINLPIPHPQSLACFSMEDDNLELPDGTVRQRIKQAIIDEREEDWEFDRLLNLHQEATLTGVGLLECMAVCHHRPAVDKMWMVRRLVWREPSLVKEIDTSSRKSPLHFFSERPLLCFTVCQRVVFELLIKHGGMDMVKVRDRSGNTPLHTASSSPSSDASVMEWLCLHGAAEIINAPNRHGKTALRLQGENERGRRCLLNRMLVLFESGATLTAAGVRQQLQMPLGGRRHGWEARLIDAWEHFLEHRLIYLILLDIYRILKPVRLKMMTMTQQVSAIGAPLPDDITQLIFDMLVVPPSIINIGEEPLRSRINKPVSHFIDSSIRLLRSARRERRALTNMQITSGRGFFAVGSAAGEQITFCKVINTAVRQEAQRWGMTLTRIKPANHSTLAWGQLGALSGTNFAHLNLH